MNQERMREILLESIPLATEYEIAQFLNHHEIKSLFSSTESKGEGWVSVEDRLPPIGIHVLCEINETMCNEKVNMIVIDYTEKISDDLFEFVHNYKHNYRHWQPLPTPPQRSEGATATQSSTQDMGE